MVTLTQLEELLHFAECGTLSGAAEKCHISQPALSRSMQKLEDDFGVPLFNRGRTGQRSTRAAVWPLKARAALFQVCRASLRMCAPSTGVCAP